jgi:diacylglycerol O-acyltransferase
MPALSVIDLAMFLLETPERPFNIGPLIVLDPPERGRKTFADRLVKRMLERPVGPPFNYRLRMPLVGVPSLEPDPKADPKKHVHRRTLPAPGSFEQLSEEVCKLHAERLDRSRMLWEVYVFDGLEGGKVGVYGKAHHGIIDGKGFVMAISNWLAPTADDPEVRAMWEGLPRRSGGGARASITQKLAGAFGQARGTAGSALGLYRMLAEQALKSVIPGSSDAMALPFAGIPKVFAGKSSAQRSFAYGALPIAELKALGKAHGSTVNDLLLATIGQGLDTYLKEQGLKPLQALVAAMPVAIAGAKGGNQIAVLQVPLGAMGLTPAERLAAVRAETAKVKDVVQKMAAETVMLYTTLVHGLPALVEKVGFRRGLPVSNLLVSNPFGLAEKRYLMGAQAEVVLPISVVPAGQMLNITAVTLDDRLQLGFLAMPNVVPHIESLARHTVEAFETLKAALQAEPAVAAPAKKKPPARKAAKTAGAKTGRRKPAARKTAGRTLRTVPA